MSAGNELVDFIRDQFRSVWALELLLLLKHDGGTWSQQELVERMRASEANRRIVARNAVRWWAHPMGEGWLGPLLSASKKLDQMVNDVDRLYATKAGAVRRLIVTNSSTDLQAFSDAFRLRRDT